MYLTFHACRQAIACEKQQQIRKKLITLTENAGDYKELQLKLEISIKNV
jgi:hypothetical protein